jgi:hypothetical protein
MKLRQTTLYHYLLHALHIHGYCFVDGIKELLTEMIQKAWKIRQEGILTTHL